MDNNFYYELKYVDSVSVEDLEVSLKFSADINASDMREHLEKFLLFSGFSKETIYTWILLPAENINEHLESILFNSDKDPAPHRNRPTRKYFSYDDVDLGGS